MKHPKDVLYNTEWLCFYYTDKQIEIGSTSIVIYSFIIKKLTTNTVLDLRGLVFQFISEGQGCNL